MHLPIEPVAGRDAHAFELAIDMRCTGAKKQSTAVRLESGVNGLTSYVCGSTQRLSADLPKGTGRLKRAREVTAHITTSAPDVHWAIGARTR